MTTRTRIRPTGLAVALAGSLGLITGTAAATAVYMARPAAAPIVRTVEVPTACDDLTEWAERATSNVDMLLSAWENGTAYNPAFRADNLDVLAYQLDRIQCG